MSRAAVSGTAAGPCSVHRPHRTIRRPALSISTSWWPGGDRSPDHSDCRAFRRSTRERAVGMSSLRASARWPPWWWPTHHSGATTAVVSISPWLANSGLTTGHGAVADPRARAGGVLGRGRPRCVWASQRHLEPGRQHRCAIGQERRRDIGHRRRGQRTGDRARDFHHRRHHIAANNTATANGRGHGGDVGNQCYIGNGRSIGD